MVDFAYVNGMGEEYGFGDPDHDTHDPQSHMGSAAAARSNSTHTRKTMTKQFDETNRGALFSNDRKETDKHPDVRGKLNINGVDHWLSGWWKQTSKGDVLSLALGEPVEQQARGKPQQRSARPPSAPKKVGADGIAWDANDERIPF